MSGVNNVKFKVNTVGQGHSADPCDQGFKNQEVEDYFENAFGDSSSSVDQSTGSTKSSDPLDSYTLGDIQNGQVTGSPYTESADWLANFPPTLEEIIAGNESAINYLDILAQKYQRAIEHLNDLIKNHKEALPYVSSSEAKDLLHRIELATSAIAKCHEQLDKIEEKSSQLERIFITELREMKDLNNDGWIGRPFFKGSYFLKYNDDGTITYLDPITKKAVNNPLMDPDYSYQLTSDNSLVIAEEPLNGTDEPTDLVLQLTEAALTNAGDHTFDCPIDIGVPEYIWVERDPDATADSPWKMDFDETTSQDKMVIYNKWSEGPEGIRQEMPEELSKYIQVQVTGMVIESVESAFSSSENPLYDHVIVFKNGDTTIARIRIEGFEASGNLPVATSAFGREYVAPSSVGIAIHGDQRASPIEIDASGLHSTGRHIVDDLAGELDGLHNPSTAQGDRAYDENIDAFTEKDQTTQYYSVEKDEGGSWKDETHNWNDPNDPFAYGEYHDRYMPPSEKPGANDTLLEFRTGIFIDGVRGVIKGTNYNDVIRTIGVRPEDLSEYAKEHLPEERRKVMQGDAFYDNIVYANGGNDVVVAGAGNNHIFDATLVDIKDANPTDINIVVTPDKRGEGLEIRNPKVVVHVEGGAEAYICNPEEYDSSKLDSAAEDEDDVEEWKKGEQDDYFFVESANAIYLNPPDIDKDIVGSGDFSSGNGAAAERPDLEEAAREAEKALLDEINKEPELDEADIETSWDEVMGAKTELDTEMNSFFDEMFGDLQGLFADVETQF